MLEIIVTIAAFAIDQLIKYWAVVALSVNGPILAFGGSFMLVYAENHGDNVSFIRGRSALMVVIRALQLALILYLLIKHKKKLAPITRAALCLFMAGLVGNQFNYIFFDFVPDMFCIPALSSAVFNAADVFVIVAMAILFVRLAFFEGRDFVDWLDTKLRRRKAKLEGEPEDNPVDKPEGTPVDENGGGDDVREDRHDERQD